MGDEGKKKMRRSREGRGRGKNCEETTRLRLKWNDRRPKYQIIGRWGKETSRKFLSPSLALFPVLFLSLSFFSYSLILAILVVWISRNLTSFYISFYFFSCSHGIISEPIPFVTRRGGNCCKFRETKTTHRVSLPLPQNYRLLALNILPSLYTSRLVIRMDAVEAIVGEREKEAEREGEQRRERKSERIQRAVAIPKKCETPR